MRVAVFSEWWYAQPFFLIEGWWWGLCIQLLCWLPWKWEHLKILGDWLLFGLGKYTLHMYFKDDELVWNSYVSTSFNGCSGTTYFSSFLELFTMKSTRACPFMKVLAANLILNSLSYIIYLNGLLIWNVIL